MASLLDMVWPSNPISGTGATPSYDPYQVQYQMAQTPQSINGQPNPAYAKLQQEYQQALGQQRGATLGNTLLSAGAGMLGATNRYGEPAAFGPALAQGIQGGMAGRNAYTQNANQQALMQAEMARAGQQAVAANQQAQMGQYQLQDLQKMQSMYGFTSPEMLKLTMAASSVQGNLNYFSQLANDPTQNADVRQRAAAMYNLQKGSPTTPIAATESFGGIFGKPEDPDMKLMKMNALQANIDSKSAANEARNEANELRQGTQNIEKERAVDQAVEQLNKQAEASWKSLSSFSKKGNPFTGEDHDTYVREYMDDPANRAKFPILTSPSGAAVPTTSGATGGMTSQTIGGHTYEYPVGAILGKSRSTGKIQYRTPDGKVHDAVEASLGSLP